MQAPALQHPCLIAAAWAAWPEIGSFWLTQHLLEACRVLVQLLAACLYMSSPAEQRPLHTHKFTGGPNGKQMAMHGQELSQLQDRVPAFPGAKAEAVVQRELGMPPSAAFRSFQRMPFAAASLGQVLRKTHLGFQGLQGTLSRLSFLEHVHRSCSRFPICYHYSVLACQ